MFVPENKFVYLKHVSLLSPSVNYSPKKISRFCPKVSAQSFHQLLDLLWGETTQTVEQLAIVNIY